jgi:hypothetical protein
MARALLMPTAYMLMRAARPTHAAEGGSQPAPLRVHPPSADDTPALPSGT